MPQKLVPVTLDGHVRKDLPDQAFHVSGLLRVSGSGRADEGFAHLYVPPPFPLGAVILSAKLRFRSRDPIGIAATMRTERIAEQYTLSEATWNSRPGVVAGSARSDSHAAGTITWDAQWEIDVKPDMVAVSAGEPWWGWRLSTSTAAAILRVYSSDSGSDLRPELEVSWSDQPSAPTGLTPSGGQVVSVSRPVLAYVFTDVSGDTALAATRVQINTTPVQSGTVEWDGTVATSDPVVDLAATSYPGVGLGASKYWRCTAQDGAGLWSDWSPWALFRRVALPTVIITAPSATHSDPTPTVRWSVTGGTQASYRVELFNPSRSRRWYNSGRIMSSSARAHQVPAGVLRTEDEQVLYVVTVWDDQPRVGTPDDPVTVEATRLATLVRDSSLTPVSLAMYPTEDEVGMVLTWTRPADPGRFAILRDGQIIDVVDSADVAMPGGWVLPLTRYTELLETTPLAFDLGWTWTDWTADPRRDHTWEVAPVVDGVTGRGPVITGRLTPIGVWLVRPQTGTRVMITNDDTPGGWGMIEQSTSHLPLGARRPVLVTQGMGGYQGAVSGELTGLEHRRPPGPTSQEQRDTFLRLKELQGATLRLVLADYNLPVQCWNMTVSPAMAGPHLRYAVGLEWAQVAGWDFTPRYGPAED